MSSGSVKRVRLEIGGREFVGIARDVNEAFDRAGRAAERAFPGLQITVTPTDEPGVRVFVVDGKELFVVDGKEPTQ